MKVIVAGDFAPQFRVADLLRTERYSEVFPENLTNLIKSADFSFLNFECPIASPSFKPILKCGSNLKSDMTMIEAIKYLGFKGVTLANNHISDFGADGIYKTISSCTEAGIEVVGCGKDTKEAEKNLYINFGDEVLAVINCCEHEFSIASSSRSGANHLNPIKQYYAIHEAKSKADYVLVIVHGGHEYCQMPSLRMQETYRFFIDAGADIVVNHHQHCYSGYENYKGKSIFYGLGNFCFDDPSLADSKGWTEGYMLEIDFAKKTTCCIHPYVQCGSHPSVQLLSQDSFNDAIRNINKIISDSNQLEDYMSSYYQQSQKTVSSFIEPFQNRWVKAAQRRKLMPSFIFKSWIPFLYNVIFCESHRDKLEYYLYNKMQENNE